MKQFVSLCITLCIIAAPAFAETKIGYVDIDTVTRQAKAVSKSFTKVGEKVNKLQTDIDSKSEKIKRLREDVQKSEGVLSKEEVDKKRKEINTLLNEVEDLGMEGRKELQRVDDTFLTPLLKKIVYAIQDVAKARDLDLVLRGEAVLYGKDTVDITNDVIKKLNMEDMGSTEPLADKKSTSTPKSTEPKAEETKPAEEKATATPEPAKPPTDEAPTKAKPAKTSGTRPVDRQPD